MTSLYTGAPVADDITSPLLSKATKTAKDTSYAFNYEDPQTIQTRRTSTTFSSEGGGGYDRNDDDDDVKMCYWYCPKLLLSIVAMLIAVAGAATSVWCFVDTEVKPLECSIWVYIMGGLCLINSIFMVKNEGTFLLTTPTASHREVVQLIKESKQLGAEIDALEDEVENLASAVILCKEAEVELKGIVKAQSSNVDELVHLVKENEETMDMIREHLQQEVIEDVVKIMINDIDITELIDGDKAKSLASKVKAKMDDRGIGFYESKFLHVLAMNATLLGSVHSVKRLLPPKIGKGSVGNDDDDDIHDIFYLPNTDPRQIGSVHAARAKAAGTTNISLAPGTSCRAPKQQQHDIGGDSADDQHHDSSCSSSDNSAVPKKRKNRLREQLYQFRMMAFPYFRESREGRCLFGTLVVLTLANSGINVYFSYLIRDFWTALAEKEVQQFYQVMYKFIISMVLLIPLQVSFRFIEVKLGIAWRKWLTARVLKLYMSNKVYYGLERQSKAASASARDYKNRRKEMDNPDQRIQEDVDSFTEFSLRFFLTIVNTVIDLISFSIILFSILPGLFLAIILFASLGTFFTVMIGKVLIKLNYESLQREADFRFSLVRIRENCESIAFYGGEKLEERETKKKFNRVIDNMTLLNFASLRLDMFTVTYNHIAHILPIFVTAHAYFTGLVEFGVIAQARQAFQHILYDLSVIVNQFQGIASFMAGIDRLFLFMKTIQELDSDRPNEDETVIIAKKESTLLSSPQHMVEQVVETPPSDGIVMRELDAFEPSSPNTPSRQPSPIIRIKNMQLATPDYKRVLIQNLNLSLAKGQNLLIAGVSGAGKSSLLRAIAGLWISGDGEIVRPRDVFFLPQRPYCPTGTLRDQLLYPCAEPGNDFMDNGSGITSSDWSDDDLLNLLTLVDLPDLARRAGDGDEIRGINAVLDWSNTLSLGEQQRLAFGRVLVNRPRLVVMDESTSALDVVAEKKMYTLLKENVTSNSGDPVTYVSVGHRPTLLAYHDLKLLLRDGLGYTSFIQQEATIDQESILRSLH